MANERQDRDLVLAPNTFAYILDQTKGRVNVYVGPYRNSLSNTDQLVTWEHTRGRFVPDPTLERAVQVFPIAAEGQYIVLSNPAKGNANPAKGTSTEAADLEIGRKVNIPGPIAFPLWPGQTAKTIGGHHLRNNQYLLVRVYDEAAAKANWKSAVIKPATDTATKTGSESEQAPPTTPVVASDMPALTMGQLIIIKGTDVSFYIPPTGIEVVPEAGDAFVREAVTLEMLEYCVLLDESGAKRYMKGPDVVFPKPTEKFVVNREAAGTDDRKFQAIELNTHSGLYVKVIADYDDRKTGEELFITGKDTPIYFPRNEHSVISYSGQQKHYAIAIPAGEGRYVLDRNNGKVDLVTGPKMFLPDPRTQVVVRRTLDSRTIDLLYPGNQEAHEVNEQYRAASAQLAPGAHLESSEQMRSAALAAANKTGRVAESGVNEFRRGTQYTPPRMLVLDTKYEGAVAVNIWPGYAVLVSKKTGERRVEMGPKMVLLEYDETLMPLELSTGRPKDDAKLLRTCYLRVMNNQVGDIISVETGDLVKVDAPVSYRVSFVGDTQEAQTKWFAVENYVKVLTDHCRSRVRNAAKRKSIQEFYANATDIIRDAILGPVPEGGRRPGMTFEENGMHIYDIEILDVSIRDQSVAQLLVRAQSKALSGAILVSEAEQDAVRTKRLEELARSTLDEQEQTAKKKAELAGAALQRQLETRLAQVVGEYQAFEKGVALRTMQRDTQRADREQAIELARVESVQFLERLKGETDEYVKRTKAVDDKLVHAIAMFGDQMFVERITTAVAPAAIAAGVTVADMMSQIFKGTPFEGSLAMLSERPLARNGAAHR